VASETHPTNVLVQQRGDVTADLKMEAGAVTEASRSPIRRGHSVHTASRDLTIEQNGARASTATRNPFQLALLDPTIVNRGSTIETQRTTIGLRRNGFGGGTKYRNDISSMARR